ncbi:hypothetical protein [Ectobacillus funiculus]|uniref:Uncharacterized protein n=1 Tax=Ectobacillus funiculus TaxID=137993 RepID=A0ABV5WA01_9BACI
MQIYKLSELDRYEKFFLYVLKDMNADKKPVALNYDKIAELIGASRATGRKAVKNLAALGYIRIAKGGGRTANEYWLKL